MSTVLNLVPQWRAALRAGGHQPRGIASYADHVLAFAAFLGPSADVTAITPRAIAAYQQQLAARVSPKTVSLALSAIRSFCRFLIDAELRADDPTIRLVYPRLGQHLPRALSAAQLRQLLAALRMPDGLPPTAQVQWQRNARVILLALYAGLRIGEITALCWRDIDLERSVLIVRGGKNNKDRSVPIHPRLLGELRLAASGRGPNDAVCGTAAHRRMADKSLSHVCERWVPRLGLPFHFTLHQLRHSFCTELIVHGANVFDVQALAGHEDPKTTAQYYRLSAEHLRSAIARLPAHW